MKKNQIFIYVLGITFFLMASGLEGYLTHSEMAWYQTLHKTSWNPPGFVFGPVWTVLYIFMGIVLGDLFCKNTTKIIWLVFILQTIFNLLWTPLFFNLHHIPFALIDLSGLVICLWFWLYLTRKSNIRFWLFFPYTIWVSFAWFLNFSILILN